MREIKFRFFSNQTNKYVSDPEDYCVTGDGRIYCITDLSTYVEFRELSDCLRKEQYTGLKDKNGKEIYEGDIVAFGEDDVPPSKSGMYGEVGHVEFNSNLSRYVVVLSASSRNVTLAEHVLFPDRHVCRIVIGNIHENPELLEK